MKKTLLCLVAGLMSAATMSAQSIPSGSDYLVARPIPAKTLFYDYSGTGTLMPKISWGLCQAWISEPNMMQGRNYLNLFQNNVSIVRLSFQPKYQLNGTNNGTGLSTSHYTDLDERLRITGLLGYKPGIYLNCDQNNGSLSSWYNKGARTQRWVNLMKFTGQYIEGKGYSVVNIAPFNEPDYSGWNQGTTSNLNSICQTAKNDSWFSGKRMMTGNTLNADRATEWYNACRSNTDEGNTHFLAGTFTNYISFLQRVKSDGKQLCQDEMHNVMEAMVGANYGMNYGIWWGTAEHARAQFCRANDGTGYRLAYLENSTAYMAASVYRNTQDGVTEAYIGAAERTATESSFGFVSKDRDVYYDGYGPTRAFYMHMPADPNGGYQTSAQKNAERVINIQSGEDVQPAPTVGYFQIMNASTGTVLQANPNGEWAGSVTVGTGTGAGGQVWKVDPVLESIGGDFSYYTILECANSDLLFYLDDNNWGFNDNNSIIIYPNNGAGCEQWYFVYAGNGSYYIHNRYSNLCLDLNGTNVVQRTRTNSNTQKWKLINPYCSANLTLPPTPSGLTATALPAAVRLSWNAVSASDLQGYTIMRSISGQNDWNTIARAVEGTTYIDNTALPGKTYSYKIKAMDNCCNYSSYSATVNAAVTDAQSLIARWEFDNHTNDSTQNSMGCAVAAHSFVTNRKSGIAALSLNGSNNYAILPYSIGNHTAMTFCGWVYWNGGNNWQRIFDFGTGEDNYLFLSPSNGSNMVFEIKANGTTQNMTATNLTTEAWKHVAVTIAKNNVKIYVDGSQVASSTSISLTPADVSGICNYLGRSQFIADPLFNGSLDDVRIYNYVLSQSEIQAIINATTTSEGEIEEPLPWEDNDTFYLYNVESGLFLHQGNDWGTQACLAQTGLAWKVSKGMSSGTYRLSRTGTSNYLFVNNVDAMYVDGNANSDFVFEYDSNTGFTTISIVPVNATYGTAAQGTTYIGWNGDPSVADGYHVNNDFGNSAVPCPNVYPLLHANDDCKSGIHWIFMTAAQYNSYQAAVEGAVSARQALYLYEQSARASNIACNERTLYENPATSSNQLPSANAFKNAIFQYASENASESNPVDFSFLIAYPHLGSKTFEGWTTTGTWKTNTSYYRNGDASLANRFYEVWTEGPGTLDNFALSQTLTNLPAGKYQLAIDAIATQQANDATTITGVTLSLGNQTVSCSTRNGAPQCFVTPTLTVSEGGSATIGFSINNTTANWVAIDNVRLLFLGNGLVGDVYRDGVLDIKDINALAQILLGNDDENYDHQGADVNKDNSVNITDLTTLVNIVCGR